MKNTDKLLDYLHCPCTVLEPTSDGEAIQNAYRAAQIRGKKEGFTPVLIAAEDEILLETLIGMASGWDADSVDRDKISAYRERVLHASLEDGAAYLDKLRRQRTEEAKEDGFTWDGTCDPAEIDSAESMHTFSGIWEFGSSRQSIPLVLAEIPVQNPWEVFAYVPFGGWNECPDTPELMAVSRYWYQRYGAVPAVITHDVLEYTLLAPVGKTAAAELASEMYAWCPDIVDQGVESVAALAGILSGSTVWFFWWD